MASQSSLAVCQISSRTACNSVDFIAVVAQQRHNTATFHRKCWWPRQRPENTDPSVQSEETLPYVGLRGAVLPIEEGLKLKHNTQRCRCLWRSTLQPDLIKTFCREFLSVPLGTASVFAHRQKNAAAALPAFGLNLRSSANESFFLLTFSRRTTYHRLIQCQQYFHKHDQRERNTKKMTSRFS